MQIPENEEPPKKPGVGVPTPVKRISPAMKAVVKNRLSPHQQHVAHEKHKQHSQHMQQVKLSGSTPRK